MVEKKVVAIIPARGGSKRIPQKNIIDFMGKPMIAWTIEAAIRSDLFSRVVVSTDDERIKEVAIKYGAEVPYLRKKFADDYAPVSEATLDAVINLENIYHETYDVVVQLMPNCPLRREKTIRKAYENFIEKSVDFQISCFKFGWMNPWWAVKLDKYGKPSPLFINKDKLRSQDMEELYCPTGAIWIAKVEEIKKSNTFYGNNHIFYAMNWEEAIDIDNIEDLQMAKAVNHLIRQKESLSYEVLE